MFPRARTLVPILVLFALSACRSFDFERQRVFLRYQHEADVLDVVIAYEGVGAPRDDAEHVAETTRTLTDIAGGQRHFMLWDWFLDLDIDRIVEHSREDEHDADGEYAAALRSFLAYQSHISVSESRFLRQGTRLCLLQRLRFDEGSRALRLVDTYLNAWVRDEAANKKEGAVMLDPATHALLLARAGRGGSWLRFDGNELEVTIPMTPEQAAVQLKELLADGSRVTARFSESLSSVAVTGEELSLRFAPAADGWIAFELFDPARKVRDGMAERLEREVQVPAGELEAELARIKAKP